MSAANRRSNYFIKKEFQTRFILKFCGLLIVSCLLMGALVYFLSTRTITASFENLRFVARTTSDFILPALALGALAAAIIVSISCIAVVLYVSHRIAGPLYHIEKSICRITGGDLTVSTNLRKTDEVRTIADRLNEMVKKIRETVAGYEEEVMAIEDAIDSIRKELGNEGIPRERVTQIVSPLQVRLAQVKRNLSYFKTNAGGRGGS